PLEVWEVSDDRSGSTETLSTPTKPRLSPIWEKGFSFLQRFVEREGHSRVERGHRENGFPLDTWVTSRRREFRLGRLTPERAARLEALPGWLWEPLEAQWEDAVAALERFTQREGHARVAFGHQEDGFALGRWVAKRRTNYRNGKLSSERVTRLEALPGW